MAPPAYPPPLAPSALPGFVDAMAPGDVRLLASIDAARLAACLARDEPARPVLHLDLVAADSAARIIDRAIAQLARAVAGLWPFLWGGEDFSAQRDDALGRAHLPIRLAALARRVPLLSQAWAAEAVPLLLRGVQPRPRPCPPAFEWAQLTLAFVPAGLVVATPLVTGRAGAVWVQAVEWLARNADVAVLVIAEAMPAHLDRILFGARQIEGSALEQEPELIDIGREEAPMVIALPRADGHPHPQSAAELKLYTLIQADADLRPIFAYTKVVPDLPSLQARADLLWEDGRLVVEIDGPEHRAPLNYRADRHRDYALLCAGYRVLRMTNEDIVADAALAVEKIRDVVRLVRREAR